MDNLFCLPPSLDDTSDTDSSPIVASPTEPHQNLADFYWSLAASRQSAVGPGKQTKPTSLPNTWQTYRSPLTPPENGQSFSTESEQGTPPQLDCSPLSPTSSSGSASPTKTRAPGRASTSTINKKMLRTSIRKSSSTKGTIKQETDAEVSPKDSKMLRARNCHNLVEKKYRNRLNNHFELLLTTVTETRKRAAANLQVGGLGGGDVEIEIDSLSGDDVESSKGGDKDLKDKTMSKSDVLRLARETILGLERKNKLLSEELRRLRGLREGVGSISGGVLAGF